MALLFINSLPFKISNPGLSGFKDLGQGCDIQHLIPCVKALCALREFHNHMNQQFCLFTDSE